MLRKSERNNGNGIALLTKLIISILNFFSEFTNKYISKNVSFTFIGFIYWISDIGIHIISYCIFTTCLFTTSITELIVNLFFKQENR